MEGEERKERIKKDAEGRNRRNSLTQCNHNSLKFKDTVKDLCDLISSVIFYYGTIFRILLYKNEENVSNRQNA